MIFLALFLFPEKMILFFRQSIKDDIFQKNVWQNFSNALERWYFKKIAVKYDLSGIIRKDEIIFLKSMILLFRLKMKDHIPQNNTWKYDIFCISGKDGIFFLQIWCWSEEDDPSNKKMILLLKKQRSSPVKLTFLVSLKKVIVILERMAFLLT